MEFVLPREVIMALWFGAMVCLVFVVSKMFRQEKKLIGVLSIVSFGLVALIYGWFKSREWGIQKLMVAFTGLSLIAVVMTGFSVAQVMAEVQKEDAQAAQETEQILEEELGLDSLDLEIDLGEDW